MAGQRIEWVDTLKGIGILFVMLGHILGQRNPVTLYVYSFHIWLFFFISGFLFSRVRQDGLVPFARRRVMTRLVPYAVFYAVSYLFFLAQLSGKTGLTVPDLVSYGDYGPYLRDYAVNLLKAERPWLAALRNHTLWFLPSIFLAELLFYGIHRWAGGRAVRLAALTAVLSLTAYGMSAAYPEGLWWSADHAVKGVVFCGLGALLRQTIPQDLPAFLGGRRRLALGLVLLFGALSIGMSMLDWPAVTGNAVGRYLHFYLPAVAGGLCWGVVAVLVGGRSSKLLFCGRNSIILLGIHVPLFMLVEPLAIRAMALFTKQGLIAIDLVRVAVVFLPALALSVPVIRAVDRFAPWAVGRRRARASDGGSV